MDTLDINECATFLGVCKNYALKLAAEGEIPGTKMGRGWIFFKAELVPFLIEKSRREMLERQEKVRRRPKPVASPKADSIVLTKRRTGSARRSSLPKLLGEVASA